MQDRAQRHKDFKCISVGTGRIKYYGLTKEPLDVDTLTAIGGFVPCHFGVKTKIFAPIALDERAVQEIGEHNLKCLAADNGRIFAKCKAAMLGNGISEGTLKAVLEKIKIYE